MPLNLSLATIYIMDGFQGSFMLVAEIMRAIAINQTISDYVAQDLYYIFGLIHWLSYSFNDMLAIINNEVMLGNITWRNYLVGFWQKTALNATWIFGNWQGSWGLAYLWNRGLSCIQPGQYCYNVNYGNITTQEALEMFKWIFNATSEVGRKLSMVYP
ncbi:MAG: hypothetical protein QXN49_07595 [Archaeoglobaceae archaeon]